MCLLKPQIRLKNMAYKCIYYFVLMVDQSYPGGGNFGPPVKSSGKSIEKSRKVLIIKFITWNVRLMHCILFFYTALAWETTIFIIFASRGFCAFQRIILLFSLGSVTDQPRQRTLHSFLKKQSSLVSFSGTGTEIMEGV